MKNPDAWRDLNPGWQEPSYWRSLRIFDHYKRYLPRPRQLQTYPIPSTDWTGVNTCYISMTSGLNVYDPATWTSGALYPLCALLLVMTSASTPAPAPPMTVRTGTGYSLPAEQFRKSIKADMSSYEEFTKEEKWLKWKDSSWVYSSFAWLWKCTGFHRITPTVLSRMLRHLFNEHKKFMWSVFNKVIKTRMGKHFLNENVGTKDPQNSWHDLVNYHKVTQCRCPWRRQGWIGIWQLPSITKESPAQRPRNLSVEWQEDSTLVHDDIAPLCGSVHWRGTTHHVWGVHYLEHQPQTQLTMCPSCHR